MGIPDLEALRVSLDSLTLEDPGPDPRFRAFEAWPARRIDEPGKHLMSETLTLWYNSESPISLDSIVTRVEKELASLDHLSSNSMARALLGLACLLRPTSATLLSRLNLLLGSVVPADVSQFLILKTPPWPGARPYQVGRFHVGRLDREKLVRRAERLKCDFFHLRPDAFWNREAVEGAPIRTNVVDWRALVDAKALTPGQVTVPAIDAYYELMTAAQHRDFLAEYSDSQVPFVAAGAPFCRFDRGNAIVVDAFVCVYLNIGTARSGYFCPFGVGLGLEYASADRRVPAVQAALFERFGFQGWDQTELHKQIKLYCRSLAKARWLEVDEEPELAFLQHVMALDRLFGARGEIQEKVSRRVAALLSGGDGEQFLRVKREVVDLYDRRSRFVHAGEPTTASDLREVSPLTRAVFDALMWLQSKPENATADALERWLKTLDFIAAGFETGVAVDPVALRLVGVTFGETGSAKQDV